jgi:hypothetical protein
MRHTVLALALALFATTLAAQNSWEEKAYHALNKKVSAEFVDTKLSAAVDFVAKLTNLTIIIDPKVLQSEPTVNLKVTDMDAGNVIKWLTTLTSTFADVKDQAIFISDKLSEETVEGEKNDLAILGAVRKVDLELPPKGVPLTDADRVKIALKLIEAENYKPTDFPGPEIGIGLKDPAPITNPFGAPK